jgi:hypothetical protein
MTSIQPELWVERPDDAVYEAAFGATVLHRIGDADDTSSPNSPSATLRFWVARTSASMKRLSPRAIDGATSRTVLVVDAPMPSSAGRWSDGDVGCEQRAWLATRENHRPLRPSMGDRHACWPMAAGSH